MRPGPRLKQEEGAAFILNEQGDDFVGLLRKPTKIAANSSHKHFLLGQTVAMFQQLHRNVDNKGVEISRSMEV